MPGTQALPELPSRFIVPRQEQTMKHSLFLAVPRMHAELIDLPQDCLTLLPGLPPHTEHSWQPAGLPWTGAEASACLAEFERAVRDGAKGTPVQSLYAGLHPEGLSEAEASALQEMAGGHSLPQGTDAAKKAQQVLLLAWLREKQSLELAALETSIAQKRHSLDILLSGRKTYAERKPAVPEDSLPPWRETFAAFLAFLPSMPGDTAFYVCSLEMAGTILEASPSVQADGPLILSASDLARLCGKAAENTLQGLPESDRQHMIALYFPENIRRQTP